MPLRVVTATTKRSMVGALAHMLHMQKRFTLTFWLENKHVFHQRLVRRVRGPFVRQDPQHTRLSGRSDKLHFALFRRLAAQSDDERILASECLNERLRLAVVDLLADDAFGQRALTVDPCQGRDGVDAGLEKGFGHDAAAVAACLDFVG